MKKLLLRLLALLLLLLLLPALPLLKTAPDEPEPFSPPAESSSPAPAAEAVGNASLPAYYRVLDTDSDRILKVTPAEYLKGVAAAELPASFSRETVIAQMVASHSYALTVMAGSLDDSPMISDDPARHQGYLTETERRELYGDAFGQRESVLDEAAGEALQWLLTSDGETLLPAVFHSCSSGMTEDAGNVWGSSVPCLTAVESPGDLQAPDHRQEFSFTMQELADILAKYSPDSDLSGSGEPVRILETSPSGTVLKAEAGGVLCTGQQLRSWLSLPSACFTVAADGTGITIVTLGRGHGVGMSQYGAEQMALGGSGWREILAHYYPGSVLIKISLQEDGI